jgi:hypothetical protein
MILSIDTEKVFDEHPFMIKSLKKIGIEWRTTENIPVKVRKRQGWPLPPLLFNIF